MLGWALTFFTVGTVAAVLGYGGVADEAAGVARVLFFVFAALCALSLLADRLKDRQRL